MPFTLIPGIILRRVWKFEGLIIVQLLISRLVANAWFERFIILVILVNAFLLGLETISGLSQLSHTIISFGHRMVLIIFILEASLKIIAVAPRFRDYFYDGWNLFDFTIIVLSLLPQTGQFATIARTMRLLRVFRLITSIPELRLIVATLIRSIPSMGHIIMLMSVLFYVYGITGYHIYHEHDPTHWGSLGLALLTLFRVVTLEDWTDVMYTAMEFHPLSWIFFVSFVIIGTFVVINLFIAVVLNNLDEAKQERLRELEPMPSQKELIKALIDARKSLDNLEKQVIASKKFER